jgi:hypothetical protein
MLARKPVHQVKAVISPCRARPIRSLVAEGRSAGGVPDQTRRQGHPSEQPQAANRRRTPCNQPVAADTQRHLTPRSEARSQHCRW